MGDRERRLCGDETEVVIRGRQRPPAEAGRGGLDEVLRGGFGRGREQRFYEESAGGGRERVSQEEEGPSTYLHAGSCRLSGVEPP